MEQTMRGFEEDGSWGGGVELIFKKVTTV